MGLGDFALRDQRVKRLEEVKAGHAPDRPVRLAVDQDLQALDVLAAVKCVPVKEERVGPAGRQLPGDLYLQPELDLGIEFRLDHSDETIGNSGRMWPGTASRPAQNAIGAYSSGKAEGPKNQLSIA